MYNVHVYNMKTDRDGANKAVGLAICTISQMYKFMYTIPSVCDLKYS